MKWLLLLCNEGFFIAKFCDEDMGTEYVVWIQWLGFPKKFEMEISFGKDFTAFVLIGISLDIFELYL